MMNLKRFLLIFLLILSFNFSYANPIAILYFSEVQIDSTAWKIELQNISGGFPQLSDCFLTTLTDTAYFKPGIAISDSFIVITQNSMLTNLSINRFGDIIGFHYIDIYPDDQIRFGNVGWNYIAAPLTHQSISLREYNNGNGQALYYYLDNTPTFGYANDTLNAKGYISGFISDSLGNPLPDVEIVYDQFYSIGTCYDIWVTTDSSGYFILKDYARLNTLKIRKQNYQTEYKNMQILPEDTITINVMLNYVIDAVEMTLDHPLIKYDLSQNYPNPFNNSTSFNYRLPWEDYVEINIYDLTGKLVEQLFTGKQNKGEYKVHWNAELVASGIYIYQLKTNNFITHKKCLLIK